MNTLGAVKAGRLSCRLSLFRRPPIRVWKKGINTSLRGLGLRGFRGLGFRGFRRFRGLGL